jgi:hypothetical protein
MRDPQSNPSTTGPPQKRARSPTRDNENNKGLKKPKIASSPEKVSGTNPSTATVPSPPILHVLCMNLLFEQDLRAHGMDLASFFALYSPVPNPRTCSTDWVSKSHPVHIFPTIPFKNILFFLPAHALRKESTPPAANLDHPVLPKV